MPCFALATCFRLLSRPAFRLACAILLAAALAAGPRAGRAQAPAAPAHPTPTATPRSTAAPQPRSALALVGVNCENTYGQGLALRLGFNLNVTLEALRPHLVFSPPLDRMRVEYNPNRDNGFTIYGDFYPERLYKVTVTPGLQDGAGAPLAQALAAEFTTPKLARSLNFSQEGKYYFPRKGGPRLALETRGIPAVTLTYSHVFPNNIPLAVDQVYQGRGFQGFDASWCEEILKTDLRIPAAPHVLAKTPFDVRQVIPADARGVFFISALEKTAPSGAPQGGDGEDEDYEGYYYNRFAGKIVIQTDLGVLAQWRDRELAVFVHDLAGVQPVANAKVTIWSTKNQVLGEGRTGADGTAVFRDFKTFLGLPKVAVVESLGDATFLELKAREEDSAAQDASLEDYSHGVDQAFLYADRELYRPGETAHLHWLVRTAEGDAATSAPLLVRVIKPNGKSLLSRPTLLSPLGTGGLDLATQQSYPTGTYTVQLLMPGNERKVIGSYPFFLEEFVPSRMKAAVTLAEDRWLAGQKYAIAVNGQHLFGGGAGERKAEAQVILTRGNFAPERWKGFRFGNDSRFTDARISCGQAQTDKDGNATLHFTWQPAAGVSFPVKGTVVGKVYEPGGRAVTARKDVMLFPSRLCLGISAAPTGAPRQLQATAAAVLEDGRPSTLTQVKLTLEKQVWNYYVRRYTSNDEPSWTESFREVETKDASLKDGVGGALFTVGGYGYYRVRVHAPGTPQYSTANFYCWGGRVELVEAGRPSLIKVTPARPGYRVGETAEVRIDAPFNGHAFVVLQGEKIHEVFNLEIVNNVARLQFPVKEEYFPCVWAQVTAVHSITRQPLLVSPFSSFAQAPIRVASPRRQLQVSFPELPAETRPAREVAFTVQVLDNLGAPARQAELTLAAVDEGIHVTTGYKSPDPWGWLTRLRKPSLNRAHYYDKIAYDSEKAEPGGDEGETGKRLGTPGENWIKPLALWSGTLTPDAQGRATVHFVLPEFAGQLRLVAVACTREAVGAQAASIFVRRPVMLQTSQPRFLLPGDLFRSQAILYNRSGGPVRARLSWSASGTLVTTSGLAELDVPVGGEISRLVDFKAGRAIGQGTIRWEAVFLNAAGAETDRIVQETPLPVHTPAAWQSQSDFFMLKPGETRELRNTAFQETANTELELTAGANMELRLQRALAWVVRYPYGCVEQTTSRLFPLYLLRQSTAVTSSVLTETGQSLDSIIRAGVDRLFSMQTADGGLAFWPGATASYPYGSVYALHCLTVMRNGRQVAIPAENFAALQRYVRRLATMQVQNPWYFDNLFQRAYSISVLALGGDLEALGLLGSFDTILMPRPGRYLLAAALAHNTHDPERVKKYLAEAPAREWSDREQSGCLSSPIRNAAIEMLALEEMGTATPAELNTRAGQLISWLESEHYGSTQEKAFVISALAGYLAGQNLNTAAAAATITDPEGRASSIKGAEVYRGAAKGPGQSFKLANTGGANVAVSFTTRGLPLKADDHTVSQGLVVERTFLRDGGGVVPQGKVALAQTESPIVRLTIKVTGPMTLKNVIVSDLLPAGLEVENPRLDPTAMPGRRLTDAAAPEHLEIRDDRLVLAFGELTPGEHHFYYLVRAVTPGVFQYPAAEAECMYDAAIRGRSGVGTLEVAK